MNSFDESFRPIVICTVVLGLTVIAMLDFMGSTMTTLSPSAARHAVSGFRLAYFVLTLFMLLLGIVYACNGLFGPRLRVVINVGTSIVFFYVFSVIGEVFGGMFESIPGLRGVGFHGPARSAVLTVLSLPVVTAALAIFLLLRKGGRHVRTTFSARRSAATEEPPAQFEQMPDS